MMVPDEYRLERVVARLIERLDSARLSFGSRELADGGYRRIAEEHVAAAAAEWVELDFVPDPSRQAKFLRREVLETFLPRYSQAAWRLTEAEQGGYGLGRAAEPAGRVGLVVGALVLLWLVLVRVLWLPVVWPLAIVVLSLPFWPDIAAFVHRRRYRRDLEEMVVDMGRIQEQFDAYAPQGDIDDDRSSTQRRGGRSGEWRTET